MNPLCLWCSRPGHRFRGHRWLCVRHTRMETMKNAAQKAGKRIPTWDELEKMIHDVEASGLKCPHCGIQMCWLMAEDKLRTLTLQHDRSGDLRILCFLCNIQHDDVPGDLFYEIPVGHKHCPQCRVVQPIDTQFYRLSNGRLSSWCRSCRKAVNKRMWEIYGKQWTKNSIARGTR